MAGAVVWRTRALANSYRAELVRAARKGLEFDPATGEPVVWAAPQPVTTTWYQHAVAYTNMKWPHLAPHTVAMSWWPRRRSRTTA